jgi:DNA-binding beta-propeller fold protein YncE
VALGDNGRWLFAVNAASNTISSFAVRPGGLSLAGTVASGGTLPTSLSVHQNLLYVLNAGSSGNISGFTVGQDGTLVPLPGSTRPLGAGASLPVDIGISRDGDLVVVTEKGSNTIDTYTLDGAGLATGPTTTASAAATPFGFAFANHHQVIVSDAVGGAAGGSALSAYTYNSQSGALNVADAMVPTGQTAACWAAVTRNGRFAYTANAGSSTISGFSIANDGTLTLLTPGGQTGVTGAHPTDIAFDAGDQYLYTLDTGSGAISAFAIGANGSLTPATGTTGLPASATGLAAS